MSISCQQCRERLGELLDAFPIPVPTASIATSALPGGNASSSEPTLPELARHVESCADCRRDLVILRAASENLRALPAQVAPSDLRARVRAQLQSEATAPVAGTQPVQVGEQERRSRSDHSTLGRVQAAWRHLRRPASVAWAGGLALAAFAIFFMQRDPNASFGTREQPLNDAPSASAPVDDRIARIPAPSQAPALKSRVPKSASKNAPNSGAKAGESADAANEPAGIPAPTINPRAVERPRSGQIGAAQRTVSKSQPEAIVSSPQRAAARSPQSHVPAMPEGRAHTTASAGSSANGVAVGEDSIRLVWLPVTEQGAESVTMGKAAPGSAAAVMERVARRDEVAATPSNRPFITPRSLGGSTNAARAKASQGHTELETALSAGSTAQSESGPNSSMRAGTRGPEQKSADSVAASAPAPAAPALPSTVLPDTMPSLPAGARQAAPRLNKPKANRPDAGGRGGGFGGLGSSRDRGFGTNDPKDKPAFSPAQPAGAPDTAPGLAIPLLSRAQSAVKNQPPSAMTGQNLMLNQSMSVTSPVRRAHLSVIAPRDIAQAQIEVVLPAGVRLIGAKADSFPRAPSQVLWRGIARRGQSIEIEFGIKAPVALASAPRLDVQLIEVPNSLPNHVQPRIIARRSVSLPALGK